VLAQWFLIYALLFNKLAQAEKKSLTFYAHALCYASLYEKYYILFFDNIVLKLSKKKYTL
jgi:hypothetical protein